MDKNLWWGYKHTNGHYQVKRFFDSLDLSEAEESPFVISVTRPFEASNREEALEIAEDLLN